MIAEIIVRKRGIYWEAFFEEDGLGVREALTNFHALGLLVATFPERCGVKVNSDSLRREDSPTTDGMTTKACRFCGDTFRWRGEKSGDLGYSEGLSDYFKHQVECIEKHDYLTKFLEGPKPFLAGVW